MPTKRETPPILNHTGLAYLTAITDTAQFQCADCAIREAEQMQVTLKRLVKRLKSATPRTEGETIQ